MNEDFYRAFEDKHRGPRKLIKNRLKVYLPFIKGLRNVHSEMTALDLGCGRGEWLELMREHGIVAQGADLDAGMLKACLELDLNAVKTDAVSYLHAQPDASIGVISAFHLVEHIPFEAVQDLVTEARRVLLPGGLLILETPNPENLIVGTTDFYLDPTHIRPIPALLLAFLTEFHGFSRCKILGLQEPRQPDDTAPVTLGQVLTGVSPDYAVVAQAPGGTDQLSALDEAFSRNYGRSLVSLTERFDHDLQAALAETRDQVIRLKGDQASIAAGHEWEPRVQQVLAVAAESAAASAASVQALREHLSELEGRLASEAKKAEQHVELKEQLGRLRTRAEVAERESQQWRLLASALEAERDALRRSWSWRVTTPLRWGAGIVTGGGTGLRRSANHLAHIAINAFQRPLAAMMRMVLRRPAFSRRITQRLMRHPVLYQQLLGVARRNKAIPGVQPYATRARTGGANANEELSDLTHRAREIYGNLKSAIERRQKDQA